MCAHPETHKSSKEGSGLCILVPIFVFAFNSRDPAAIFLKQDMLAHRALAIDCTLPHVGTIMSRVFEIRS